MAELKTKVNEASVEKFLNSAAEGKKLDDSYAILALMKDVTKLEPKMWGTSIVGFGSYHYKSKSGQEGDWFLTGFSPRKQSLTLYIMSGFEKYDELMSQLGKFKTGKGCLYINKLEDVNLDILKKLVKLSFDYMSKLDVNQ